MRPGTDRDVRVFFNEYDVNLKFIDAPPKIAEEYLLVVASESTSTQLLKALSRTVRGTRVARVRSLGRTVCTS